MEVTDISYERKQGYPILKCKIDGREAIITHEQKPTLFAYGIVFIGSEFTNYTLQPEDVPEGLRPLLHGHPLVGFVRDRQFLEEVFLPFLRWTKAP